jgi:hypothetical protein
VKTMQAMSVRGFPVYVHECGNAASGALVNEKATCWACLKSGLWYRVHIEKEEAQDEQPC